MPQLIAPAYRIVLQADEIQNIGLFIVVWNQLEFKLVSTVSILLGVRHPLLSAIMGSPNIKPKADIWLNACQERVTNNPTKEDALACWKKILDLSNFRNDIAHGMWAYNVDKDAAEARKALDAQPIDAKQIKTKLDELSKLTCKMADIEWRILNEKQPANFALPSPWHDKF